MDRNTQTEYRKSDLIDVYFFRNLVKNRFFKPVVNFIMVLFFSIIIYFGLTSEPDLRFPGGNPFATTMVWDIWLPMIAFTVILLGRLWCFACPIGAIGDWAQSIFSLNKKYPKKYRNLWIAVILLILIFATERHLFRFTRNPVNTAYLLLFFTGLVVVMGIVYEKRSFCRYICPIGLVLGIFSMLSAVELRCKSRKTCHDHDIKECIVGTEAGKPCPMGEFPETMERNNNCILCMECVKSCSKENIRLSPRIPGADIIRSNKKYLPEAYTIHGMIVLFLFVMGMEHSEFRNVVIDFVKSTLPVDSINFLDLYWRNMWAIIIFALITLGAAGLLYLSTRVSFSGRDTKKTFIELSYAFIPLSLSTYLAENTFRLIKGIFFIIATTGELLGKVWEFTVNFETINQFQLIFLTLGFLFTIWAGYLISKRRYQSKKEKLQGTIAVDFAALVYLIIGFKILTLPVV